MTLYTFLPVDPARKPVQLETFGPAAAMTMIDEARLGEVDVLEDGAYAFSCKMRTDDDWTIFRRLRI